MPAPITAEDNPGTYADRTAVEDVMARYVWAVDSFDADGCVAVFTEDAVIDTVSWHTRLTGLACYNTSSYTQGMVLEIKLRKIGNSVGVVLPKEALAHLNLREGDKVCVTEAADGSLRLAATNPEFSRQMAIAKDVMQRYRNTLRELAK